MSLTLTNAPQLSGLRSLFSGLGARLDRAFTIWCSSNRYARQLEDLAMKTDEDLAARGTSRPQEIARIIGAGI